MLLNVKRPVPTHKGRQTAQSFKSLGVGVGESEEIGHASK